MRIDTFLQNVTSKDGYLLRVAALDIIETMNYDEFSELCNEMSQLLALRSSVPEVNEIEISRVY